MQGVFPALWEKHPDRLLRINNYVTLGAESP